MTRTELHRVIDELSDDALARLDAGTPVTLAITNDSGRLTLREIDPEQAWFWTPAWLAGEREADADLAAGRSTVFASDDEFLAHLADVPPAST
jgi:hypothetical protein